MLTDSSRCSRDRRSLLVESPASTRESRKLTNSSRCSGDRRSLLVESLASTRESRMLTHSSRHLLISARR